MIYLREARPISALSLSWQPLLPNLSSPCPFHHGGVHTNFVCYKKKNFFNSHFILTKLTGFRFACKLLIEVTSPNLQHDLLFLCRQLLVTYPPTEGCPFFFPTPTRSLHIFHFLDSLHSIRCAAGLSFIPAKTMQSSIHRPAAARSSIKRVSF